MKQLNFNNQRDNLTPEDIEQILSIVAYRTRIKTHNRLRSVLTYGKGAIPHYVIFERLIKDGDSWQYFAGQSYTDEIRTIREIILK
jgi:hypothetical protein